VNGVGSEQSHHSLNFFLAVETSDRFNRGIKRHAICYHKTTSLITQRLYRPLFAYYHMHDNLPHCAISELNFYNITTRHTRVAQHMLENPPFIDMCSLRVPGVPERRLLTSKEPLTSTWARSPTTIISTPRWPAEFPVSSPSPKATGSAAPAAQKATTRGKQPAKRAVGVITFTASESSFSVSSHAPSRTYRGPTSCPVSFAGW